MKIYVPLSHLEADTCDTQQIIYDSLFTTKETFVPETFIQENSEVDLEINLEDMFARCYMQRDIMNRLKYSVTQYCITRRDWIIISITVLDRYTI